MWDNSNSIGNHKDDVFKFIKKFIRNKDLNVGKDGTHLGFITFSGPPDDDSVRTGETKKDRTRVLLKVGEITDPEKIINNLTSYNYKYDLSGVETHTGTAFKLALEVSRTNAMNSYLKEFTPSDIDWVKSSYPTSNVIAWGTRPSIPHAKVLLVENS